MSGEALAMYDAQKLEWCRGYTEKLRKIELTKWDEICAHVLEYMEVHTKLSPEEIEKRQMEGRKGKGDQTKKETLQIIQYSNDLMFGVWANVQGKSARGEITFGNYATVLPNKQATQTLVLRCLWTSYDYLTPTKIQDDIVVGGIVNFQMYTYPEPCRNANKWVMRNILTVEQRLRNIPFPDPTAFVAE